MHQGTILEGINRGVTVKITYRDKDGQTSSRETEPYEIKNGRYFGYCLQRNGIRGFTLANIISAELTGNRFTPRF